MCDSGLRLKSILRQMFSVDAARMPASCFHIDLPHRIIPIPQRTPRRVELSLDSPERICAGCPKANSVSGIFRLQRPGACMDTADRPQPKIERLTKMITRERDKFSPDYSTWFGTPVVMLVVIRQFHVPMPCRIVSESLANVRIRTQSGGEMDVRKELIVAVEEDAVALPARVH